MNFDNQMKRGKNQALYKYLPETWIDFSVRGKERNQYIAKVTEWKSKELKGINAKRLLRMVSGHLKSFESQWDNSLQKPYPLRGFDSSELTVDNCRVLTPEAAEDKVSIVASIDPLTFYCKECKRVYQFKTPNDYYKSKKKCSHCGGNLAQLRQMFFCECGHATGEHNISCGCDGTEVKWDGKYNFVCLHCGKTIPMEKMCKVCNKKMYPKSAMDGKQFIVFNFNLIDLINEKSEEFISKFYGPYATFAYHLGKITKEEFDDIIDNGIFSDPDEFQKICDEVKKAMGKEDPDAAAKADAEAEEVAFYNSEKYIKPEYFDVINNIICKLMTDGNIRAMAEQFLEYNRVKELEGISDLNSASEVAKLLNTTAQPEKYAEIAAGYGITSACVCDKIPFIACSYGYTRKSSEYAKGARLNALKKEDRLKNNVYAVKLDTEGVLFEFDRKKIIEWLLKNNFISQEEAPDMDSEEDIRLWFINNIKLDKIKSFSDIDKSEKSTRYVYSLIHSISHLLIKAAADIGGLSRDSLSEYIFAGVPAVLIYCQNSQGFSLGSLFNTFEAYFDRWLERAFQFANECVFDPVCIEKHKACTGCLFINELSCQHFNKDLDRSLVIGYDDREKKEKITGFWEEQ